MVTAHTMESVNTLVAVFVISASLGASYFVKKKNITWLPESVVTMILGGALGALARAIAPAEELKSLTFDPAIFFFVLLPPIIFEAGYSLQRVCELSTDYSACC